MRGFGNTHWAFLYKSAKGHYAPWREFEGGPSLRLGGMDMKKLCILLAALLCFAFTTIHPALAAGCRKPVH